MAYSNDDARTLFTQTLKDYGFDDAQINELLPQVLSWQTTYTPSQIVADLLPTTAVYQKRFSANAARVKAGMPALSAKEYLAAEQAYRATIKDAGLPEGFYDSNDDVAKFIANDVSASELKTRVDAAMQAVDNADPAYTQALQELYGVDRGTMAAHFLDADRALPLIQKQAKALEFGTAAAKQGLKVSNIGEQFATNGPATGLSAEQGYSAIGGFLPQAEKLASVYGQNYDQATAEQEVFGGLASAKRKRQKLGEMEQDAFSGSSGVSAGSLASSKTGSF